MRKIIHIGLPKSASSSLQVGLSACDDIVFLGLYPTQNVAEDLDSPAVVNRQEIPYLIDPRIKEFYLAFGLKAYSANEQSERYCAICADYKDADKALFFSYEGFTSPMFSEVTPEVKLQRLVECCKDAEFLFVARNQATVIQSQYRDWPFDLTVANGKGLNLNEWCENELGRTDDLGPLLWFNFERLLSPLLQRLPRNRINVLLFEDFVSDREKFCSDLSQLLGGDSANLVSCLEDVQSNCGVSARYNMYRKFRRLFPLSFSIRLILPKWLLNLIFKYLNRGGAASIEFEESMRELLKEQFSTTNRKIADEFNLPLGAKGYWL